MSNVEIEPEATAPLQALLDRFRGHQRGTIAFANVLLASHRTGSPIGRIINRFRVLNSMAALALKDELYDAGVRLDHRRRETDWPMTAAAGIARHASPFGTKRRRRAPMTPECLAAAQATLPSGFPCSPRPCY
jgi:hypothetical protein